MIQREVLAYRAPLYNRATAHLYLQPQPFGVLADLFPGYSAVERAQIYACVGGVPQFTGPLSSGELQDTAREVALSQLRSI